MWYDYLYKTEFLRKLYDIIPSLKKIDVRIDSIIISDEGSRVAITFDMPYYADFPPSKWNGCNTTVVEVEFSGISKLEINTKSNTFRGEISINKNTEELLEISIRGNVTLNIIADSGFIQRVSAYLLK
jgi:hypothetical protein